MSFVSPHATTSVLLALVAGACHAPPAPPDDLAPRPVVDVQRFAVHAAGKPLGTLVQREIRDPKGAVRLYLVENQAGQWLGYADEQGRFYRYEPFAERERFLGVYTMDKGLGLLYDVTSPVQITPVEGDARAREASAEKRAR